MAKEQAATMLTRHALLFTLPLAIGLTGCDMNEIGSWNSMDRFREDFQFTYALNPGGALTLENFNGSVEISAWEKNEVAITGVKYAGTEQMLRALKVDAESQPGSLSLRTVRPEGERCNCGAKYVLRVPAKVILRSIVSSNGSLRVEGIEGEAHLQTSNGSVKLHRHAGNVWVKTSNAGVEALSLRGDLVAKTSNGSVRADGLQGAFEAVTSNASISARIEKLPTGRPLRAESSNGSVDLSLPGWVDQPLEVSTSNASITVRLPGAANAEVRARTSNAKVHSDFAISGDGEESKNRLEGKIGNGGTLLRITTSNGGINLQKL